MAPVAGATQMIAISQPAAACAKHVAVHSGPENERHTFDAVVSPRDLHDTYLPAFKKLVTAARVEAVRGAFNRINGEPCCATHLERLVEIYSARWHRREPEVLQDLVDTVPFVPTWQVAFTHAGTTRAPWSRLYAAW